MESEVQLEAIGKIQLLEESGLGLDAVELPLLDSQCFAEEVAIKVVS